MQYHYLTSATVFPVKGLARPDLLDWLITRGVSTGVGAGLATGGSARASAMNTINPSWNTSNINLERICHPLLFSGLARTIKDLSQDTSRHTIARYLQGDADVMAQFWESVTFVVAQRLHKHLGPRELTVETLRSAFVQLYSSRKQSPWTLQSLRRVLSMLDDSDHKAVRNQLLQIGVLEEVDQTSAAFSWAFAGYDPNGSLGETQ